LIVAFLKSCDCPPYDIVPDPNAIDDKLGLFWMIYRFDQTTCLSMLESAMATTLVPPNNGNAGDDRNDGDWRAFVIWDGGSIS
jgi:hypothetical protein